MPQTSPYKDTVVLQDDALNQLIKIIKSYPIAGSGTGIKLVPYIEYSYEQVDNITSSNFDNFTLYTTTDGEVFNKATSFTTGETYYQKIKTGCDKLQIQNTLRFTSDTTTGKLKITDESFQAGKADYPGFTNGLQEIQVGDKLQFFSEYPENFPINPDGTFTIIRNGKTDSPEYIHIKGFSDGRISINDDTEAYRYTDDVDDIGDPGTNIDELTHLVGSITTKGGISAGRSIKGYKLYGAVFNDYAEYRTAENVKPGDCVIELGDGSLAKSSERLQAGANIVSDTFGFAIGETKKAQTPIAVCGRVLAYPAEDKLVYTPGAAVCAAPDGKVSVMSREEIRNWPDRIVGYVSEIPSYDYWGSDNIAVNGRIWIKIK